jgi:hypothetical protein
VYRELLSSQINGLEDNLSLGNWENRYTENGGWNDLRADKK